MSREYLKALEIKYITRFFLQYGLAKNPTFSQFFFQTTMKRKMTIE